MLLHKLNAAPTQDATPSVHMLRKHVHLDGWSFGHPAPIICILFVQERIQSSVRVFAQSCARMFIFDVFCNMGTALYFYLFCIFGFASTCVLNLTDVPPPPTTATIPKKQSTLHAREYTSNLHSIGRKLPHTHAARIGIVLASHGIYCNDARFHS